MESLALVVSLILLVIVAVSVTSMLLSILSWAGKVPKGLGIAFTAVQFVVTAAAFLLTQTLPITAIAAVPFIVCVVFVFLPKRTK